MRFPKWVPGLLAIVTLSVPAGAQDMRIGMVTPPPHQWTRSANALADRISAETEGRIKLAVFPSGQLGNEAQMLQQLQTGALDLAFLTVGELANRDADFGILTAPYLVPDAESAAKLLEGPTATALQEKLGALGLKGLGYGMAGMRIVLLSKPLPEGGNVAGRKIRTVPLAQEMDFWTRAGAAPTPLPLPELFDAYSNGQIDGMQIDLEGTWNNRFQDYSAVVLDSRHAIFPMFAVASGRKWRTLPEEDRALITRLVGEEAAHIRAAYAGIDADYRAKLKEAGAPLVEAGPEIFGGAVESWYAAWREKMPLLIDLENEAKRR
ncbi:C4-dicarboxylate ABC transporter substrate-binding protein [Haematobacter massiliensis]|uniref:TRAP transporter substrate-binding protein n=1 Tax=Haematobacter massiliensis TaxID=195105 RepID=UPI000B4A32A0|nr:TRAP transporter substrate-binding protein [Haematobacter massiliensis]OWJ73047.1 C4-dicarboxylate ABC transporter substrate-binding protein [Haematobacter massiliensis]QBJ25638.1 TRAP transporter substrate-binding protein [Haematobacter massiliensis]